MRKSITNSILLLVSAAILAGCSGNQSMLAPAGEQAGEISDLWWLFCIVMSVIYVLVVLFLVIAIARRRTTIAEPELKMDETRELRLSYIVGGLVALTITVLFVFMIRDFLTGQTMRTLNDPNPIRIQITAHQWWWNVQYENDTPSNQVTTANEIHLPIGKAVRFDLQSADVIHSFWAPNFDGKKDIVPGHPTSLLFRPTKLGTFYGQCGEFCGLQHAHMRLVLVVESSQDFQNWLTAQSQPAHAPDNEFVQRGQKVFLDGTCIMCHSVSGTPARATVGPDLSHVASRQMLAAGTIYNTKGHLGGWILDAPKIKPGVIMPQHNLSATDFQALLGYLESLK